MFVYYVSLTKHFTPYNIPSVPVLIQTLRTKFENDDFLTVIPLGGAHQGVYKVMISTKLKEDDLDCPVMVDK